MALIYKRLHHFTRKSFYRKCYSTDFWKSGPIVFDVPLSKQPLKFIIGKYARFADGCCVVRSGNTEVAVTAVVKKQKASVASFVPLKVDYRQKSAAAGYIPANHSRRESPPNDKEILTSRIIDSKVHVAKKFFSDETLNFTSQLDTTIKTCGTILQYDRSVRPLFPKGFGDELQLVCQAHAVDGIHVPDVLGINAASAALAISDIPWNGPIGAVRVGYIDGEVVINPTRKEMTNSSLDLVIAANEHNQVVMLDASADHMGQQDFMRALKAGVKETRVIIRSIYEIQKKFGKPKRELDLSLEPTEDMIDSAKLLLEAKFTEVFSDFALLKVSRDQTLDVLKQEAFEKLKENYTNCNPSILYEAINAVSKQTLRNVVIDTGIRCDGRGLQEVRDISCSVNDNTILHGCSLFQRGQTQVKSTVAFDSLVSSWHADPLSVLTGGLKEKHFMLRYEFAPYATNEIGPIGAIGRREIGHGALAEKSLLPVMPTKYPFTTQLTAEVLESNGSSSMAAVCGGSLALMDAGVPITAPVAGVAMGLISVPNPEKPHEISDFRILTDILGIEDYLGDMDFKIAGSEKGITAAQLDIKIPGLPLPIIMDVITQAADAKSKILNIMNETISKPRETRKDCWPVVEKRDKVPIHKLRRLYGIGGVNRKKLREELGVQLTQLDSSSVENGILDSTSVDNGIFSIFAPNSVAMAEAKEIIDKFLIEEKAPILENGGIYTATIVELRDSGVMVILYPSMKPTLLPNSQLDQRKIRHPSALNLKEGQEINVKYYGQDPASGSMRISRRALHNIPSQLVKKFVSQTHSNVQNTNSAKIKS